MASHNSDGQVALSEGDNSGRTVLFHSCNKLVRLTQVVMVQAARQSKLESASTSQVSTYVMFAIVSLAKVNCTAKCRANVRRYYPGHGYGEM